MLKYFATGTSEGEKAILNDVFVVFDDHVNSILPDEGSPRVLIGKKGTGKSAIIYYYSNLLERKHIPSLIMRPSDIDLLSMNGVNSIGDLTRIAKNAIIRSIAIRIGEEIKQHGLISDEDGALLETAIEGGYVERSGLGKMARSLAAVFKPKIDAKQNDVTVGVSLDLSKLLPDTPKIRQLESAINKNLNSNEDTLYVFIDDTDQVAAPGQPEHLNRIWAFLLAARSIATENPRIKITISLREEIWRRLSSEKAGQRDQTDHFMPLLRFISPTEEQIGDIVERRLREANRALGLNRTTVYSAYFDPDCPKMPLSNQTSSWRQLIVKRSRGRTRDAIQLINKLTHYAKGKDNEYITDYDFAVVMKEFSRERAELISNELEEECPQTLEIIRSLSDVRFDEGSFKCNPESLRKKLAILPSSFGITLFGKTLNPNDPESVFQLWRFLWVNGILGARILDVSKDRGFRHISPDEDSRLISSSRWNDIQAVDWEINAVYRDYLISIKADKNNYQNMKRY